MQRVTLKDKTFVPYITSDKIQESVRQMSKKINADLAGELARYVTRETS